MELSTTNYDFAGWATCSNRLCSDGRTIMPDAFKHHDGAVVPLVWNHQHGDPNNILGKALLHSRDGGVYAYCQFNETEQGVNAKALVDHSDISALSIYAYQLTHNSSRGVTHGMIREVSLVLARANPGAFIDSVMKHGEESEEEAIIYTGEDIVLYHADKDDEEEEKKPEEKPEEKSEEKPEEETTDDSDKTDDVVEHKDSSDDADGEKKSEEKDDEETIGDVLDTLNEKQRNAVYAVVAMAIEATEKKNSKESEGGNEDMKHNVFEGNQDAVKKDSVLSHADQEAIIALAKTAGVGSLKAAMEIYAEQKGDELAHGTWENVGQLFPDFKDVHPGAPELLERDMSWVGSVMTKSRKSPVSRVRTRQADGRATSLRAKGYNDREIEKKIGGSLKLYMRTTEPTTVYVRDTLHRDDINDVTDFDVVAYQKTIMKHNMEEVIALASLVGDLREDTDPDKIDEEKIRPIWKDDELYTIHQDIDLAAARAELQGSDASKYFGESFIRAEAMVAANLYASEKYKGKGAKSMYIDPHELNVMLLARDRDGRRIYDSKADLAKAFNVDEIHTVEQFNGLTRTTKDGKTKKLLALVVNMGNYQFGSTKGGEMTSFDDFDIKFNTYEYLMETRVSGALAEVFSAIAIEEDVTEQG